MYRHHENLLYLSEKNHLVIVLLSSSRIAVFDD